MSPRILTDAQKELIAQRRADALKLSPQILTDAQKELIAQRRAEALKRKAEKEEDTPREEPGKVDSRCGQAQPLPTVLATGEKDATSPSASEDAPAGHKAWTACRVEAPRGIVSFTCAGERFQTTAKAAGDIDEAARIARLCYVRLQSAANKAEVVQYRNTLYEQVHDARGCKRACSDKENDVPLDAQVPKAAVVTLAESTLPPSGTPEKTAGPPVKRSRGAKAADATSGKVTDPGADDKQLQSTEKLKTLRKDSPAKSNVSGKGQENKREEEEEHAQSKEEKAPKKNKARGKTKADQEQSKDDQSKQEKAKEVADTLPGTERPVVKLGETKENGVNVQGELKKFGGMMPYHEAPEQKKKRGSRAVRVLKENTPEEEMVVHRKINELPEATSEEMDDWPAVRYGFDHFMEHRCTISPVSAKNYSEHINKMFLRDGRSFEAMARAEYRDLIKQTNADRRNNHILSAGMSKYIAFFSAILEENDNAFKIDEEWRKSIPKKVASVSIFSLMGAKKVEKPEPDVVTHPGAGAVAIPTLTTTGKAEVCVMSGKVSIIDPVMLTRIGKPVRGLRCEHLAIFDRDIYVEFNQMREKRKNCHKLKDLWLCPHCSKPTPEKMLVDLTAYAELLATLPEESEVEHVHVAKDGKLSVVA